MPKHPPPPSYIEPQLCTLVKKPPSGGGWAHEVKWDGYRLTIRLDHGKVRLFTRNGHDWTGKFPTLAAEAALLPAASAYLDGELCALDGNGASDFSALQRGIREDESKLVYFAFDLMFLDGSDLRQMPLMERRQELRKLLAGRGKSKRPHVRLSEEMDADGAMFFRHACQHGLEGIISKRRDAAYRSGRTSSWVKIKCSPRQELVIGGYAPGGAGGLASLLLGHFEKGKLVYDGRVGTGFSIKSAKELVRTLDAIRTDGPKIAGVPGKHAGKAVWVLPKLVCEVRYTARTADGYLRQASFLGLREDKPANKVTGKA